MTEERLHLLADAARVIGKKPKTIRNNDSRVRSGLPVSWHLSLVRVGTRIYVRDSDLQRFLDELNHHADDDHRAELQRIAADIHKLFPEHAKRLRELSAFIPHNPPRRRKPAQRKALRRVGAPVASTGQDGVQP